MACVSPGIGGHGNIFSELTTTAAWCLVTRCNNSFCPGGDCFAGIICDGTATTWLCSNNEERFCSCVFKSKQDLRFLTGCNGANVLHRIDPPDVCICGGV